MINPNVVEGQIAGGTVQGIGGVLFEHLAYDEDGNPLTTTFMDYLLPTATDVPIIEYGHVETPAPGPGGYKGVGEGGAIGAPPAVVNAVADALAPLGVEITRLPLTPGRDRRALHRGGRVVKPAPFEYHRPATATETVGLLAELGDTAKVLAGGQSLVPMLALRLAVFEHLVDVGRVEGLRGIERTRRVGPHRRRHDAGGHRAFDAEVATAVPLLARATPLIGHFQIRNRGTIGGSLAHADPAAEYPAVALALDARAGGPGHRRARGPCPPPSSSPASGPPRWATTSCSPAVTFPVWSGRCGFAVGSSPAATATSPSPVPPSPSSSTRTTGSDAAASACSGSARPLERAAAAEAAVTGASVDELDPAEVGRLAVSGLDAVPSDLHGSADYRRRVGAGTVAARVDGGHRGGTPWVRSRSRSGSTASPTRARSSRD